MHIEAIYDKGRLEFKTPLRLKRDTLTVIVEVPDEAIETASQDDLREQLPPEVIARAKAMREALDAIRDAPPPPDDELPALSDKQRQRLQIGAVSSPAESPHEAEAFRQEGARTLADIRQLLGPFSKARPVTGPAEDKAALAEALADKYD